MISPFGEDYDLCQVGDGSALWYILYYIMESVEGQIDCVNSNQDENRDLTVIIAQSENRDIHPQLRLIDVPMFSPYFDSTSAALSDDSFLFKTGNVLPRVTVL
jgi:hypothetical protein